MNDHLFRKELFIRFTTRAFRKLLSIYVFSYFPFGFEGRMWDLIVSVPDHCLSFYFTTGRSKVLLLFFLWWPCNRLMYCVFMSYHVTSQSRRPAKWSAPFSQTKVITMLGRTKTEPPCDKTNKMTVRPAKTQISLGIRPVGLSLRCPLSG